MSGTRIRILPTRPGRLRAFTLVELLVVVAVIGGLAALTVGVLPQTRAKAQRAKSSSNLRQIGLAIQNYAWEHQGRLPPTRHAASAQQAWIFKLGNYLDNVDEVRICPADPQGAERLRRRSTSYIVNDLIFDEKLGVFEERLDGSIANLLHIEQPARTMLAFVISEGRGTGPTNDHAHAAQWTTFHNFLVDVEADRFRAGRRHASRLRGDSIYLYADGSVRNLKPAEIKSWIEAGNNPALVNNAPH